MRLRIRDKKGSVIERRSRRGFIKVLERWEYSFELVGVEEGVKPSFIVLESVEDGNLPRRARVKNNRTSAKMFFLGCLGQFSLTHEGETLCIVDVESDKLRHHDAEGLFQYLHRRNNRLLLDLLESNRTADSKLHDSNENNRSYGLLLRISAIKKLVSTLTKMQQAFCARPHSRLRKGANIVKYENAHMNEESIQWVLCNLNEVDLNLQHRSHKDAFPIVSTFGRLNRVASCSYQKSFKNYENELILGTIFSLYNELIEIQKIFKRHLDFEEPISKFEYASFDSIKRTIFEFEIESITDLLSVVAKLVTIYSDLFKDATPQQHKLKLTHVFATRPHYRSVFRQIAALKRHTYDPRGDTVILGVRNIQDLYERYVLYRLLERLEAETADNSPSVLAFSKDQLQAITKFRGRNETIYLYYQPQIDRFLSGSLEQEDALSLVTTNNSTYCPDFVIRYLSKDNERYAVLDAKYTTAEWLVKKNGSPGDTTLGLAWKYGIGLSKQRDKNSGPDYVWAVFPGMNQSGSFVVDKISFSNNDDYYPVIGILPERPDSTDSFNAGCLQMLENWRRD